MAHLVGDALAEKNDEAILSLRSVSLEFVSGGSRSPSCRLQPGGRSIRDQRVGTSLLLGDAPWSLPLPAMRHDLAIVTAGRLSLAPGAGVGLGLAAFASDAPLT